MGTREAYNPRVAHYLTPKSGYIPDDKEKAPSPGNIQLLCSYNGRRRGGII